MKLEYFIVMGICIAGPLVLSFSRKINFYKSPARLIYSIIFPMIIFVVWDIYAVGKGHWSFNEKYITGLYILYLPIEEILFFIVIPFCALFSWEVVKYYSNKGK
ncbi:MAG TPA: lycopene cyclase domain-containing protein [Ignavibacteria bacterium]|nr:lycopene cyclase domain-containing protein [Ignavibacteria bacterium]